MARVWVAAVGVWRVYGGAVCVGVCDRMVGVWSRRAACYYQSRRIQSRNICDRLRASGCRGDLVAMEIVATKNDTR